MSFPSGIGNPGTQKRVVVWILRSWPENDRRNENIYPMDVIDKSRIVEMLETVVDPEIGVDIWTMGLIYDIDIVSETAVRILMTLTTPFCPVGPQIKEEVEDALKLLGFREITIDITFEPPWQPSVELKAALGLPAQ